MNASTPKPDSPPSHAIADLWWTTDAELKVVTVGAGSSQFADRLANADGKSIRAWLEPADGGQLASMLESVEGGASVRGAVEFGGRRCQLRIAPLSDAPGWSGALFDIGELGEVGVDGVSAADVRQHQRLEVIGTLASGVAHEINNPIQSIMNYAQLIRNRSQSEQLGEYAKEILYEAQRVAGIVKNLLFFARQEGEPYAEAFMAELVEQTMSLTAAVLRREQVHVEVEVPGDLPAVVCHPQQIQQVILNLVTHARDALNARYPKTDPNKRLRISAALVDGGRSVRTTFEDQGGGMDPADAAKLFDPERLRRNYASGLGLSVCYAIVHDHGGGLSIDSEKGSYSRIHVDLPVASE